MQGNVNANGDAAANSTTGKQKSHRKKTGWIAAATGPFFDFLGLLAPGITTRTLTRLLFSPSRAMRRRSTHVELNGAKVDRFLATEFSLCLYRWGDGNKRVLLVHGWDGNAAQMTEFVEPLRAQGYSIISIDLPAHGASSGTLSSVVHFQEAILQLDRELGPFHGVVAHSLGAAAITFALSRGMTCERVVFVGPISTYDIIWAHSQRLLNVSSRLIGLTRMHVEKWQRIRFDEINPTALAPQLSVPLLVIHDYGDLQIPIAEGESLVQSWPGAKLVATKKLGHNRILRDPTVTALAADFIHS